MLQTAIQLLTVLGLSDLTFGLVLLGLGVALYIVETMNPGFFVAIPGTVLLVAGFLMVVEPTIFQNAWSWLLIIAVAVAATWVTLQVYRRIAPPEKSKTTIGLHNVVGLAGRAETDITPEQGAITIEGERWRAISEAGAIPRGSAVVVVGTEGGLTVRVRPSEPKS